MPKRLISELKEYFKATKRPTESQFADLLDSYAHLDSEIIKGLATSEYTAYVEFPPDYQVGDYIEFLTFQSDMASSSGFYEISVAYTRDSIASAATHLAAVSHANPNIWRECGKINRNNYVGDEHTNCFTFDVNGALRKFRIRATKVNGATNATMFMVIKVRSINKNLSWIPLNTKGNDTSSIALQPMTDEWELLLGSAFSSESAKVAIKAKSNGNVGIGTGSPTEKLSVGGIVQSIIAADAGGTIELNNPAKSGSNSARIWRLYNMKGPYGNSLQFWPYNDSGNFFNPQGYVLKISDTGNAALQGKFEAKDFVVSASPTADFVFAQDYNLRGIQDLEKFISEKQHLPEIPSAKEMTESGVTVGEFQIKLLQKIEELTLYTIAQHKELEQLKLQVNANT